MPRDYLNLGTAPAEEKCVQAGAENYEQRVNGEARRFIAFIRHHLGPEPEGCRLLVRTFPYDDDRVSYYKEVVIDYDLARYDSDAEPNPVLDYVEACEAGLPETWVHKDGTPFPDSVESLDFDGWFREVDRACSRRIGLGISDLADQPFREWFEQGVTPDEAVSRTLESEGLCI